MLAGLGCWLPGAGRRRHCFATEEASVALRCVQVSFGADRQQPAAAAAPRGFPLWLALASMLCQEASAALVLRCA